MICATWKGKGGGGEGAVHAVHRGARGDPGRDVHARSGDEEGMGDAKQGARPEQGPGADDGDVARLGDQEHHVELWYYSLHTSNPYH